MATTVLYDCDCPCGCTARVAIRTRCEVCRGERQHVRWAEAARDAYRAALAALVAAYEAIETLINRAAENPAPWYQHDAVSEQFDAAERVQQQALAAARTLLEDRRGIGRE